LRYWDGSAWTEQVQPAAAPVAGGPNVTVNFNQPTLAAHARKLNAIAYLVLTIFLGGLGVHRFMRGQIGIGILYLITGGLFGIGWLIDLIFAIIWVTQMDSNNQITFINKKYARYSV